MSKKSVHQYRLDKLKKQAKRVAKSNGIIQSEALELIAKEMGFDSWFTCRRQILQGAKLDALPLPNGVEKIFAQDYDPSIHTPDNVIGLRKSATGDEFVASVRHSILNYISDSFQSANDLRNIIEDRVKHTISISKNHTEIHIDIFLNTATHDLIENPESFFNDIVDRFTRLTSLNVIPRDEPLSMSELQTMLEGKQ